MKHYISAASAGARVGNPQRPLGTELIGPRPLRVPEQRKPEFSVATSLRQDLYLTGGRRPGFCRVCSVRPTVCFAISAFFCGNSSAVAVEQPAMLELSFSSEKTEDLNRWRDL